MTNISVSIDEDLLIWLDQLIKDGIIKSRSDAVRGGIYTYIKEVLGFESRKQLKEYIKKKQIKPFQDPYEAIKEVREEEDI